MPDLAGFAHDAASARALGPIVATSFRPGTRARTDQRTAWKLPSWADLRRIVVRSGTSLTQRDGRRLADLLRNATSRRTPARDRIDAFLQSVPGHRRLVQRFARIRAAFSSQSRHRPSYTDRPLRGEGADDGTRDRARGFALAQF